MYCTSLGSQILGSEGQVATHNNNRFDSHTVIGHVCASHIAAALAILVSGIFVSVSCLVSHTSVWPDHVLKHEVEWGAGA